MTTTESARKPGRPPLDGRVIRLVQCDLLRGLTPKESAALREVGLTKVYEIRRQLHNNEAPGIPTSHGASTTTPEADVNCKSEDTSASPTNANLF